MIECQLKRITPEQCIHQWDDIERVLNKGRWAWENRFTIEVIRQGIINQAFQLWTIYEDDDSYIFFLSQVIQYPKVKCLQVFWALGQNVGDKLDTIVTAMEELARKNDCGAMEIEIGRPGWAKLMAPWGFRSWTQTVRKDVMPTRSN